MRQSELLDLKWQDVDMKNKIGVRRMVIKSGEHLLLGEPRPRTVTAPSSSPGQQ